MKKTFLLLTLCFQLLFFTSKAVSGYWEWAQQSGPYEQVSGQCMGVDASGNIIVLGHFLSPTMSLGGITISRSSVNSSSFIAKYSPDGTVSWLRPLTTDPNANELAYTLTCENDGSFIIGGWYLNSLTIDTISLVDPPASGYNLYIAKFDSSGNVVWANSFNNGFYVFWDIATDANGNIIATGAFQSDSAQFDSFTLYNHATDGSRDVFTLKCNSAGDVLWVSQAGGIFDDSPYNIAIDNNGNAIVSGTFRSSTMNCGNYTIQNSATDSTDEIFIYKLDPGGNVLWARSAGSKENDNSVEAAIDSSNNIYLTGNFESDSTFFGQYVVEGNGSCSNTYLTCIDPSGQFLWAMSYGRLNSNNTTKGVALESNGEFYLGGRFPQYLTIDGQQITGRGSDLYIAKFDSGRHLIWYCTAGATTLTAFSNMVKDNQGNIYVTGYTGDDHMYFGNHSINYPHSSASSIYNFFIAKLSQTPSTGINIPFYENKTIIYPNPTTGLTNMQLAMTGHISIEVYNQLGENIIIRELDNLPGLSLPLDFSKLNRGIYLIKIIGSEETLIKKVILE